MVHRSRQSSGAISAAAAICFPVISYIRLWRAHLSLRRCGTGAANGASAARPYDAESCGAAEFSELF